MDPNKALANIRALARDIQHPPFDCDALSLADELAETVEGLDQWMSKGGFPPNEWNHDHTA